MRADLVVLIGDDLPACLDTSGATSRSVLVLYRYLLEFHHKLLSYSLLSCIQKKLKIDYVDCQLIYLKQCNVIVKCVLNFEKETGLLVEATRYHKI